MHNKKITIIFQTFWRSFTTTGQLVGKRWSNLASIGRWLNICPDLNPHLCPGTRPGCPPSCNVAA